MLVAAADVSDAKTPMPTEKAYHTKKTIKPSCDTVKQVVGGSSNKQLAAEIAAELGLKCGAVTLGRYADGEVMVQLDEHVRGKGENKTNNTVRSVYNIYILLRGAIVNRTYGIHKNLYI